MSTWKWHVLRAVGILAIIVLPLGSLCSLVYLSYSVGMDAEYSLHAYGLVLEVLADYLNENSGQWPKSWDDLVVIRHSDFGLVRWPDDIGEVKKRVRINFDVTTADIISSGVHFTAVTQRKPNYGSEEWRVPNFLEAARRSLARIPEPAVPKGNPP